jgi:c-di-GMP-related signal transduction protein
MPQAVASLALPDDVSDALLQRSGPLGRLMRLVESLEAGNDAEVATLLAAGRPCSMAELPRLQVAAMAWANSIATPAD